MALVFVATDMPHPEANLDVPILAPFFQEELGQMMAAGVNAWARLQLPNGPPSIAALEGGVMFHSPWFVPDANGRATLDPPSLNPHSCGAPACRR